MPGESTQLLVVPDTANVSMDASDQYKGPIPPMHIFQSRPMTGPIGIGAPSEPNAYPDIEADYNKTQQKNSAISTAIFNPAQASKEDLQTLQTAQAFGWTPETELMLEQAHKAVALAGSTVGKAVPSSMEEIQDHPIVSTLKTLGFAMDPAGQVGATLGGESVEKIVDSYFPGHPIAKTVGQVIGGILGGGVAGGAKNAAKSAIVDEAGNPLEAAAAALTPEQIAEQTRAPQAQLESYAKALKEYLQNPDDEEFQNLKPGTILNAEDTANLNIKTNTRIDNLSTLAKAYMAADSDERREAIMGIFKQEVVPTAKIIKSGLGVAAEHGRALALHNTDWAAAKDVGAILATKGDKDWDGFIRAMASMEPTQNAAARLGQGSPQFGLNLEGGGPAYILFANDAIKVKNLEHFNKILTDLTGNTDVNPAELERRIAESGQIGLNLGGQTAYEQKQFAMKYQELKPEDKSFLAEQLASQKAEAAAKQLAKTEQFSKLLAGITGGPLNLSSLETNLEESGQMLLDIGLPVTSGQMLLNLNREMGVSVGKSPAWSQTPEAAAAADKAYAALGQSRNGKAISLLGGWLSRGTQATYKTLVNAQLMNPRIAAEKIATDVIYQPYNITMQALATGWRFKSVSAGAKMWASSTQASLEAIPDAWKFAKATVKSGAPEFQKSIGDVNDPKIFALDYDNSIPGKAASYMSSAFGIGTRSVMGTDQFAKAVAHRAELNTQSFYRGMEDAEALGLSGTQAVRYAVQQSKNYMETMPQWLRDAASENMHRDTFTDEDAFTRGAKQITDVGPIRLIAPFTRTPINLLENAMMNSPFAMATHKYWRDTGEGGLASRTAQAKLAFGSMMTAWMIWEASKGNIIGNAPTDPKSRDAFMKANSQEGSIRIGHNLISVAHLGPIGQQMILAANFAQFGGMMSEQDRLQMALGLVGSMAKIVGNAPLLEPMMNTMSALGEGIKAAGSTESGSVPKVLRKWAGNEAASLIPAPLKMTGDAEYGYHRQVNGFWDAIKSHLPSFDLPPPRDQFGNVQYLPHGSGPSDVAPHWWDSVLNSINPLTVDHDRELDDVDKEQMRVKPSIGRVPDSLWVRDPNFPIPIDPQTKDRWAVLAGSEVKLVNLMTGRGQLNQHDQIEARIKSKDYQDLAKQYQDPDVAKIKQAGEIEKIHRTYIELGKQQLLRERSDLMVLAIKRLAYERPKNLPKPTAEEAIIAN